jgi:hypothetical protein
MPVTTGLVIAGVGLADLGMGTALRKAGCLGGSWRDIQYRARTRQPRRGACTVTR